MTITKRTDKGSALTFAEMDENIRDLREDTDLTRVLTNGSNTTLDITTSGSVYAANGNIDQLLANNISTFTLSVDDSVTVENQLTANTLNVHTINYVDRNFQPGDVIEMIAGHADGRTLVGRAGSYTLQNVTTAQLLTTTFTSIGLDIDYIPPAGTKTVLYESQFQIRHRDSDPILSFKATWDGNDLEPSRSVFRVSGAGTHQLIYNLSVAIEVNASSVDIPKARIGPWTTAKTLSWTSREYSDSYEGSLHTTNNWEGSGTDIFLSLIHI